MKKYRVNETAEYYKHIKNSQSSYAESFLFKLKDIRNTINSLWHNVKDYKLAHGKTITEFAKLMLLKDYTKEDREKMATIIDNMASVDISKPYLQTIYALSQGSLKEFLVSYHPSCQEDFAELVNEYITTKNIPSNILVKYKELLIENFDCNDFFEAISNEKLLNYLRDTPPLEVDVWEIQRLIQNATAYYLAEYFRAVFESGVENE